MTETLLQIAELAEDRREICSEADRRLWKACKVAHLNGVRAEDIAAAAGVTRRTVYHWFDRV